MSPAEAFAASSGPLASLADMGISYGFNAMASSKAHDRQKNMMTRGPGYMMQGLRSAGLNPILAVGGLSNLASAKPQMAHAATRGQHKPAIDAAQFAQIQSTTTAQTALADKLKSERDLADTRNIIEGFDKPKKAAEAALYSTPTGVDLILQTAINQSLPNSVPGLSAKMLLQGGNRSSELDSLIGSVFNDLPRWLQKQVKKMMGPALKDKYDQR